MAKTIKFNLILDDYSVRNIEELQEHFSIENMLAYFENGLLLRWLKVRGYEEKYADVSAIDKSLDKKDTIIELIRIFEIADFSESKIEEAVAILSYKEYTKEQNSKYIKNHFAKKEIIKDYHFGYENLIADMEENHDNMAKLKADAFVMKKEYLGLFKLDNESLFFRLSNSAPRAIFALLTIDAFREFWIDNIDNFNFKHKLNNILDKSKEILGDDLKVVNRNTQAMAVNDAFREFWIENVDNFNFKHTSNNILDKSKEILGDDLKVVNRNTQAMWDHIETGDVRVMVISIEPGTFVKNYDDPFEKLDSNSVNYKLPILNGLDYQCNNEALELLYIEV